MPECFDARKSRVAEAFAEFEASPVGEFGGADLFAAFQFDGLQAQKRCVATGDEPIVLSSNKSSGRGPGGREGWGIKRFFEQRCGLGHRFGPQVASLAAKCRVSAGPGSEAAHAVINFLCGEIPVDAAILFLEN